MDGDPVSRPQKRGLMVDTGATSHIVTDITKFKDFDENFKPQKHILELVDGVRTSGVALKRGAAKVRLIDRRGCAVDTMLMGALYVSSYPQHIFSVKAATARGATVIFKEGQNELIHKDGMTFGIQVYDRLYYLNSAEPIDESNDEDGCHGCYDLQTWHEILGHCNYDDVLKLESVTEGMKIKGKSDKSNLKYEVCMQGKFAQSRNREPDERATAALALVHTDLAGPIEPQQKMGSGTLWHSLMTIQVQFLYIYLKAKSDTVASYGKIKYIRSDLGKGLIC